MRRLHALSRVLTPPYRRTRPVSTRLRSAVSPPVPRSGDVRGLSARTPVNSIIGTRRSHSGGSRLRSRDTAPTSFPAADARRARSCGARPGDGQGARSTTAPPFSVASGTPADPRRRRVGKATLPCDRGRIGPPKRQLHADVRRRSVSFATGTTGRGTRNPSSAQAAARNRSGRAISAVASSTRASAQSPSASASAARAARSTICRRSRRATTASIPFASATSSL